MHTSLVVDIHVEQNNLAQILMVESQLFLQQLGSTEKIKNSLINFQKR